MTFKLSLREKKSPHFMETKPRYDVLVNDKVVDELYFNMTGYRGCLMNIDGHRVALRESGISTFKREVGAINREAKIRLERNSCGDHHLTKWARTVNSDVMHLTFLASGQDFQPEITMFVDTQQFKASTELMDPSDVTPLFFEEVVAVPLMTAGDMSGCGFGYGSDDERYTLAIFDTSDLDWLAVASGSIKPHLHDVIMHSDAPVQTSIKVLSENTPEQWADGVAHLAFISRATMENLIAVHGSDFMPVRRLPGSGTFSEKPDVFAPIIASSGDRPMILLTQDQDDLYAQKLRDMGHRVSVSEPLSTPEP